MKKTKSLIILMSLLLSHSAVAIEGEVKRQNFKMDAAPLLGEFEQQVTQLQSAQVANIEALEKAETAFINCDAELNQNSHVGFAKCSIEAAQKSRSAYKNVQANLEKLNQQLQSYMTSVASALSNGQNALDAERKILAADNARVANIRAQAEDIITGIEGTDPDMKLSLEQEFLVADLIDDLTHNASLVDMHKNGIRNIQHAIDQRQKIEIVMKHINHDVKRMIRRSEYRQTEAGEYIRMVQLTDTYQAHVTEGAAMIGLLNAHLPELEDTLNSVSAYANAMAKMPEIAPKLPIRKPQTAGEAIQLLKKLLSEGGSDDA